MQIQHIETFIDLYKTRSFIKTAENMYLSQSAISQQIKSLEREMDCVLFTRSSHEMKPTESGRLFYSYAINIVTSFREVKNKIRKQTKGLYIHVPGTNTSSMINRTIIEYSYEHPETNVELLNPVDIKEYFSKTDMEQGHIYFVRRSWLGNFEKDDITYVSLGNAFYCCIMHPECELRNKNLLTLDDICKKTIVFPSFSGNRTINSGPYYEYLIMKIEKDYSDTEIVYEKNELQTMSRILSSKGRMVSVMPNMIDLPQNSPLIVKPLFVPQNADIGLTYKGAPVAGMKEFIEKLSENVRSQEKYYHEAE